MIKSQAPGYLNRFLLKVMRGTVRVAPDWILSLMVVKNAEIPNKIKKKQNNSNT